MSVYTVDTSTAPASATMLQAYIRSGDSLTWWPDLQYPLTPSVGISVADDPSITGVAYAYRFADSSQSDIIPLTGIAGLEDSLVAPEATVSYEIICASTQGS